MDMRKTAARLWTRALLSGTRFSDRHAKLRLLYSLEDPWEMASPREQHRFAQTNAQLLEIAPRFGNVLELGCGEGHQSIHISRLCSRLYGVDLSAAAVERARRRCPEATFATATLDEADTVFADVRFDLVTACEVLYYAREPGAALEALKARTRVLYVSNFLPRSERIRELFAGPGWRPLSSIAYDTTTWECFVWERPGG